MATRSLITTRRAGWSLNTGIFLFSNCQWSLDLLNAWPPMGPKCPFQVEAGMILTLTGNSEFEADHQSGRI
jgi:xyloglucan 6-xylosyltransferase